MWRFRAARGRRRNPGRMPDRPVDEFAERFSDGYDTIIGERAKIQRRARQRVSIARAIWPIRAS